MTWRLPAICFFFVFQHPAPSPWTYATDSHPIQGRPDKQSWSGFRELSGGLCCAKWSVQEKQEKKEKWELYASSSTFGRLTASQGNRGEGGPKWGSQVSPFLMSLLSGIWPQPGSVKSQLNVCVASWPPPSSSFTLTMISPPLVMMENLSCFWALHLRALSLWALTWKQRGNNPESGGRLLVPCTQL